RPDHRRLNGHRLKIGARDVVFERQFKGADGDRHAERQRSAFLNAPAVDPYAVAAVQVDDVVGVAFRANLSVKSRDAVQAVVEHDFVALVTSDADRVSGETNLALDSVAAEDDQLRHIYLLRIPVCRGRAGGAERRRRTNLPETAESIRSAT